MSIHYYIRRLHSRNTPQDHELRKVTVSENGQLDTCIAKGSFLMCANHMQSLNSQSRGKS